ALEETHDDRLGPAVQEEVLHGVGHRIVHAQTAELARKVSEPVDDGRIVHRPGTSPPDERRDRRRHADDGVDATGDFLNVDAWIADLDWHKESSLTDRARFGLARTSSVFALTERYPTKTGDPPGRFVTGLSCHTLYGPAMNIVGLSAFFHESAC